MFRTIAALALASASANTSPTLNSNAPWWEKVTVTVTDDGQTQSCRYESSLGPNTAKDCSVVGDAASMSHKASANKDQYTRITFERRYSPGAKPDLAALPPSETLLGGQVMALAIDGRGAVKGCKIVQTGGEVTPQYGCSDAAAEKFAASAATPRARSAEHEGYMTILVYGHSEHVA
ncbi:MAG TPA: hypothetical protein VF098_03045 [Sphingomicrobium sp.]